MSGSSADDRARELFNDALELAPDARRAFVEHACGSDVALHDEVTSLLAAWDDDGDFLDPAPARGADEARRIGHFELRRELGRGGQGTVHLAWDRRGEREVALKLLALSLTGHGGSTERFHREIEATRRLDHPGVCRVLESGELSGVPYLAMEYVEGQSLRELLEAGDEAEASILRQRSEVLGFVAEAARILHAAHRAGLVHRDIKPGNLMVTGNGRPVILDFGLAHDREDGLTSLTRTGEVLGTPSYLAPEQLGFGQEAPDPRTDVYSLGVTLYECLTGRRPFSASTRDGLYHQILEGGAPDARRLDPTLSFDLAVVVDTAMARDPDDRYESARAFAEDLDRVRAGKPILARRPGALVRLARFARRDPSLALTAAGLFLVVLAALFVSLSLLDRANDERDTAAEALNRARALGLAGASFEVRGTDPELGLLLARAALDRLDCVETRSQLLASVAAHLQRGVFGPHDHKLLDARYSPDARHVLVRTEKSLWLRRSTAQAMTPLSLEGQASAARFLPDGSAVLGASYHGEVKLWDLEGRERNRRSFAPAMVLGVDAAPDGRRLAVLSEGKVRVWRGDDSGAVIESPADPIHVARFLPGTDSVVTAALDGLTRLWTGDELKPGPVLDHGAPILGISLSASTGAIATFGNQRVRLWSASGERLANLEAFGDRIRSVVFSPTGDAVVVACDDHDCTLWSLKGELLHRLSGHEAPVNWAEFSTDGSLIVSGATDLTARVWDLHGNEQVALRGHKSAVMTARFSPDRRAVLTASADRTARVWELCPAETPVLRGHRLGLYDAQASADGKWFVTASRDRTARVWTRRGDPHATLAGHQGMVFSASFDRDGSEVLTTAIDGAQRRFDLGGQFLGRVAQAPGRYFGQQVPDEAGRRLVRLGMRLVVVRDAEGKDLARLAGHEDSVWWAEFSPDGEQVVTASGDRTARLWDLQGRCLQVFEGHEDRLRFVRFSPDGRLVATASDDGTARLWTRDGRVLATLVGHEAEVLQVSFSRSGKRLATVSRDKTARLWDLDGRLLAVLSGHRGVVWSATFVDDDTALLTSSSDRTARYWIIDAARLRAHAERLARPFTPAERQRFAGLLDR